MKKIVWHYTSESALQEIKKTHKFYPSYFKKTDTAYGEGWYFTDLPPWTPVLEMCDLLWTDFSLETQEKTKGYLKFEIDDKLIHEYRPHVYLLKLKEIRSGVLDLGNTYTDTENKVVLKFIEAELNSYRKF